MIHVETNARKLEYIEFSEANFTSEEEATNYKRYCCSINLRIMTHPVYDPRFPEYQFEKSDILRWLDINQTHPFTRARLTPDMLIPNLELKHEIDQFVAARELIDNFKSALATQCLAVIKSMWENKNSPLKNEVKELDDTNLTELIEKVLSSSPTGKSEFITIFLNFISNKPILEACLNKRIFKTQSTYVKNQVTSLRNRLTSIEALSVPPSINQHIQSYHSEGDDEFNAISDELITDENRITPHSYETPLLNNSLFNNNNKKRPLQASSRTQHKSQRPVLENDEFIDLMEEFIADDAKSNY